MASRPISRRRLAIILTPLVIALGLFGWFGRARDARAETVREAVQAYCDTVLDGRRGEGIETAHAIAMVPLDAFLARLTEKHGRDAAVHVLVVDTGADTPQPKWSSTFGSPATHAARVVADGGAPEIGLWLHCPDTSGPITLLGAYQDDPPVPGAAPSP